MECNSNNPSLHPALYIGVVAMALACLWAMMVAVRRVLIVHLHSTAIWVYVQISRRLATHASTKMNAVDKLHASTTTHALSLVCALNI